MKKILLVILSFVAGLILFMPKLSLYYTLENLLKKEHITLKASVLKDRWIDLNVKEMVVSYDGIDSLKVDEVKISPWLLYNVVHLQGVSPTKDIAKMFNAKADEVDISYVPWNYKRVKITAIGDFGALSGWFDIFESKIHLLLEPSDSFKNNSILRQYFKKQEEGWVYESKL